MSEASEGFVAMGEIVKAVGLKGEVKLAPTGDFLADVIGSRFLRRQRGRQRSVPAVVQAHRLQGDCLVMKMEDLNDRAEAEAVVGEVIGFRSADYDDPRFPRPAEPAPFLYVGLAVETLDGERIGVVQEVLVLPAHPVLRVRRDSGEALIPVVPAVVRRLDRDGGRVIIDPIPGLLDDQAEVAR